MNGFVVLNKGEGVTSFKAAAVLRKIYSEKKTGHTGTLDPMATGVLPVAMGKATRFIDFLPFSEKGYTARLRFGITTDTLDITGKVLSHKDIAVKRETVEAILGDFRGEIMQLPPMYSAIQKDGVRLYDLARQGIEVEREQRQVTIKRLELTSFNNENEFEIEVLCSKGTYIRSLIADMGERLGCGAVMTSLHRTLSNGFSIDEAKTAEELESLGEKAVYSVDYPFMCFPEVRVSAAQARRFSNGGELSSDRLHINARPSYYRVYSPENAFLGLGEITSEDIGILWARRVIGND